MEVTVNSFNRQAFIAYNEEAQDLHEPFYCKHGQLMVELNDTGGSSALLGATPRPGVPKIMATEAQEVDAQGTLQATVSVLDSISSSALAAKVASLRGRHHQACA